MVVVVAATVATTQAQSTVAALFMPAGVAGGRAVLTMRTRERPAPAGLAEAMAAIRQAPEPPAARFRVAQAGRARRAPVLVKLATGAGAEQGTTQRPAELAARVALQVAGAVAVAGARISAESPVRAEEVK